MSSRILTLVLVAVLLMSVVCLARVQANDWLIANDSGTVFIECQEGDPIDIKTCRVTPAFQEITRCHDKMREAMRLAVDHNFWPLFDLTDEPMKIGPYYPPECDRVCRAQHELNEAKARQKEAEAWASSKQRWNDIYKECVQ